MKYILCSPCGYTNKQIYFFFILFQLSKSYSELTDRFARMDPSYLNLANKVFVSNKYSLNDDFSKTARSFIAEVDSLNFAHPKSAADIINEWVSIHISSDCPEIRNMNKITLYGDIAIVIFSLPRTLKER